MATEIITARILAALGASGALLAAAAAGCGSTGTNTPSGATGSRSGGGSSTTVHAAGVSVSSSTTSASSGGTGGTPADAGAVTSDSASSGPPCVRRPFLVDGTPRAGLVTVRADWMDEELVHPAPVGIDAAAAAAIGEAWALDGTQEHASIAAFSRFTMLLVAVGAPPDLIVASQRASIEEVAHAQGCFALARRFARRELGPGEVQLRDVLGAEASLADVAALTVHEGCVGETLGVLLATEQLAGAEDPAVRTLLDRVVREEQRHAELAWRFVRWALARGGAPVRDAVAAAFEDAARETRAMRFEDVLGVDASVLRAHGRLASATTRALVEKGLREIIEPCRDALRAHRLRDVEVPAALRV